MGYGIERLRATLQRRFAKKSALPGPHPFSADRKLPLPPLEMRLLTGPSEESAFELGSQEWTFPLLAPEAYEAVFDFGCGCGRNARKLIQQVTRPRRYVGIDLHRGMIGWCQQNLRPRAPGFEFLHHDVFNPSLNSDPRKPKVAPFPVEDAAFSLVVAWSVFTHLAESQASAYLQEVARILKPHGTFLSTWFLFDKRAFPMMQSFQNALYINELDPTNAVIYDRDWFLHAVADAGLAVTRAEPPEVRGFQWVVLMSHRASGGGLTELPADDAPLGVQRPPIVPDAEWVGLSPKRRRAWFRSARSAASSNRLSS